MPVRLMFQIPWVRLVLASLLCLQCLFGHNSADAAELPTLDEIKRQLTEMQQQLDSLYLKVLIRSESPGGPEAVTALGKVYIPESTEYFAFVGDKRYRRTVQSAESAVQGGVRPTVDPNASTKIQEAQRSAQEAFDAIAARRKGSEDASESEKTKKAKEDRVEAVAYDGNEVRVLRGTFGQICNPRSKHIPGQFNCTYLKSISFFLPDPASREGFDAMWAQGMLPESLSNGGDIAISKEIVDGVECARVSVERDVTPLRVVGIPIPAGQSAVRVRQSYLFDLEHNLMIRMSQIATPKGTTRATNSQPNEVRPGLWLPMECRVELWGESQSTDAEPTLVSHLEVLEMSPDVDDSLFRLELPAGTLVYDIARTEKEGWDSDRTQVSYTIPADASLLDEEIARAVARTPSIRRTPWLVYATGTFGLLCIAVALIFRFRRKQTSQRT